MIDGDVQLGPGVRIFDAALVNIYGCSIGEETFVGPFVEITRGVSIGRKCKVESHSFICDGVRIEDGVFIGHGVMFTNDLYPKTYRQVRRLPTRVEADASIGSGATIVGGVTIGRGAVVGAGAVVVADVPPFSIVAGNPARILRQFDSEQDLRRYIEQRQETAP
jgi:UDP-2-acetamido-3-amino-2,3-dideoxy-glucuronate N-acetyltransferase